MSQPDIDKSNIIVVSNRGPAKFTLDHDGQVSSTRAGGGLSSSLADLLETTPVTWICAPMSRDEYTIAASRETEISYGSIHVEFINPDKDRYSQAYNSFSNSTLWFLYHSMFDRPMRPSFTPSLYQSWESYKYLNQIFANKIVSQANPESVILVQDYHLHLVARYVKEVRPDLRMVHFIHTPMCSPEELEVLPKPIAQELMGSITRFDAVGLHSRRWQDNLLACCKSLDLEPPNTFFVPLGIDPGHLHKTANSPGCQKELRDLSQLIHGRKMILRVDRIDLSKNILRGFEAFDLALERCPEMINNVTFIALLNPSRQDIPQYIDYRDKIECLVDKINTKWTKVSSSRMDSSLPPWEPVHLEIADNYARSVAALQLYDVLVVNPIKDGLNLVAKEGPCVNNNNGILILSQQAGVYDELGRVALTINPFDVSQCADQVVRAVTMSIHDRCIQSSSLKELSTMSTPATWLETQLRALV